MNNLETEAFARKLLREVWERFDAEVVHEFYHHDVIGHHRAQTLNFDDVVNRLKWDRKHSSNPTFDIQDIIATDNRFALRFLYAATETATGHAFHVEVIYFYHLRQGKICEFWLLADQDFDYKAAA